MATVCNFIWAAAKYCQCPAAVSTSVWYAYHRTAVGCAWGSKCTSCYTSSVVCATIFSSTCCSSCEQPFSTFLVPLMINIFIFRETSVGPCTPSHDLSLTGIMQKMDSQPSSSEPVPSDWQEHTSADGKKYVVVELVPLLYFL